MVVGEIPLFSQAHNFSNKTGQFVLNYSAVRRQNTQTHISEIVEESNFSGTAYNSTYVSDVRNLIAKKYFATIFRL